MLNASSGTSLAFAHPAALALAALLVPLILLYFLRMRFRKKPVGSTFIWRSLAQATSGGESLRRRSVYLLLIQVAAVLAAAAAAAGPSLVTEGVLKPGLAVVIDVSASMATRDCVVEGAGASRLDAAIRGASAVIDGADRDAPIAVFACASASRLLTGTVAPGKAAAKAALRALKTASSAFDEASCADQISAALSRTKGSWNAAVFTDGGLSLDGEALAAAFSGSIRYEIVGSSGETVGVTGLVLDTAEGTGTRAAFSLWNGGGVSRKVSLKLERDGEPLSEFSFVAVPGWSRGDVGIRSAPAEGLYGLRIARSEADLGAAPGESYYLSVARKRNLSVLLVGRRNPFLEASLAYEGVSYTFSPSLPEFTAAAAGTASDALRPDVVICDASAGPFSWPKDLAAGLLVFGAPPPDAPLSADGRASGRIVGSAAARTHPLSRFIDWEDARAETSLTYAAAGGAVVLATVEGRPVLAAWERDGYRSLACGVDLSRSDLGLKTAFPVLLQNYLQWFAPRTDAQSAYTLVAGESARRLEGASFAVRDSSVETFRSGPAVVIAASEAGVYGWTSGDRRGLLAVNVPPSELDVSPRRPAPRPRTPGGSGTEATAAALPVDGRRRIAGPFCAALAALLAAEWLLWYGGTRLFGRRRPGGEGNHGYR